MSGAADTDTQVVVEQPSYLEMSDEEAMKAMAPVAAVAATNVAVDTGAKDDAGDDKDGGAEGTDAAAGDSQASGSDADAATDKDDKEAKKDASAGSKDEPKDAPAADKEANKDEPKVDDVVVDYKAQYERLLAPFKANGREIQVGSVDDAISLMQMGANYNKKMAALKPNLKLMKLLENSGFMSEEKINFLIDLGKKDPGAINKLVKEAGLDPMDLDGEKAGNYKPTTRTVDDREIELDTVLEEIKDSASYTRTLDVVSNKWDAASKQVISQSPQLLKVIDGHIANGIYDLISTEVERERVFGRLNGMSDIEAYRQVGDAIQARGGFNHLGQPKQQATPQEKVIVQPKPKAVEDDKLKEKRRAASSTKPAGPTVAATDFNPLSLSDDEFSKLVKPKFV